MEIITGRCHCGKVRYEAKGPIIRSSICECSGCQRATGTFNAPFVTVSEDGFKLLNEVPKSFTAEQGDRCDAYGSWYFCPHCGTHVYWKSKIDGEIDLFAGTLDDTSFFQIEKKDK